MINKVGLSILRLPAACFCGVYQCKTGSFELAEEICLFTLSDQGWVSHIASAFCLLFADYISVWLYEGSRFVDLA